MPTKVKNEKNTTIPSNGNKGFEMNVMALMPVLQRNRSAAKVIGLNTEISP
jgi:hypothetical protein